MQKKDQSNKISGCFPNLFCQIGTQLADHLETEYDSTNIDIKGANFEETFLKAKLWARSAGDRVDAVVEALVGKFSTVRRVKLEVRQQSVVDRSNLLLLTTFLLPLNLANSEQEKEEKDGC